MGEGACMPKSREENEGQNEDEGRRVEEGGESRD